MRRLARRAFSVSTAAFSKTAIRSRMAAASEAETTWSAARCSCLHSVCDLCSSTDRVARFATHSARRHCARGRPLPDARFIRLDSRGAASTELAPRFNGPAATVTPSDTLRITLNALAAARSAARLTSCPEAQTPLLPRRRCSGSSPLRWMPVAAAPDASPAGAS
eukprot:1228223-Pleurochrysis_carterae.AAC.1